MIRMALTPTTVCHLSLEIFCDNLQVPSLDGTPTELRTEPILWEA